MDGLQGPRLTCACMLSALLREAFHHADSSGSTSLAGATHLTRNGCGHCSQKGPAPWLYWHGGTWDCEPPCQRTRVRLCLRQMPGCSGAGGTLRAELVPAMLRGQRTPSVLAVPQGQLKGEAKLLHLSFG